jgi:hypothetical protein
LFIAFYLTILALPTSFRQASQELSKQSVAPKSKMTYEISAGVATPDQVETRIGTLKFFDG